MTEVKLGSKHECPSCSTKFYDLGKSKPLCPSCGADLAEGGGESAAPKKPASKKKKKK